MRDVAEHARRLALAGLVGVACGGASALFLFLLDLATSARLANEALVFALPLAGFVIGLAYERWGTPIRGGNSLVLETFHAGGPPLPLRLAPMVLVGTVLTHLFGGSAGREGTAVQMGGGLADAIAQRFGVSPDTRRALLVAGMAGGFGSVFGTPLAGAIFGIEVPTVGRPELRSLAPALVASFVGDLTTRALGITHTDYPRVGSLALDPLLIAKWIVFAAAIAASATAFLELTHFLAREGERRVPRLSQRMALGGALVVVLWQLVGTSDYLGLGVPTIVRAFDDATLAEPAFALKLLFTAITLSAGFLGGEVTPLFFVGAALGNVLARALGLPLDVGAAVGMAAMFACASNAPLALTVMAVELVGVAVGPHALFVSVLAFFFTGHRGLYGAQRVARRKTGARVEPPRRLKELDADAAKQ